MVSVSACSQGMWWQSKAKISRPMHGCATGVRAQSNARLQCFAVVLDSKHSISFSSRAAVFAAQDGTSHSCLIDVSSKMVLIKAEGTDLDARDKQRNACLVATCTCKGSLTCGVNWSTHLTAWAAEASSRASPGWCFRLAKAHSTLDSD